MASQDLARLGTRTLQSRVERWEADFNRHWNVRFYARSFQLAAEVIAVRTTGANPGAATAVSRQIRFHKELFVSAPVTVRSSRIASGVYEGAVLHILTSGDTLSATAVDLPGLGADSLPSVEAEHVTSILPRSIGAEPHPTNPDAKPKDRMVETGPVRPIELDHTGALLGEDLFRRAAVASHDYLSDVGFTPEFVQQSSISRMSVEVKISRHSNPALGSLVRARSRLTEVGRKSFKVMHWLEQDDGTAVATIEQCLVSVDLNLRRAVEVPAFLRDALAEG